MGLNCNNQQMNGQMGPNNNNNIQNGTKWTNEWWKRSTK